MANNNTIYNAIIAGITAGNQKRWELTNSADFTIYNTLVNVIAGEIDARIPSMSPDPPNASQLQLIHSICEGYFQDQNIETIRHSLQSVADTIASIFTQLNDTLLPAGSGNPVGETIPNGTYVGQPIAWDGDSYQPLPENEGLKLNQLNAPQGTSTFFNIDGDTNFIGIGVNGLDFPGSDQILLVAFDPNNSDNNSRLSILPTGVTIETRDDSGFARYTITADGAHEFSGGQGGIDGILLRMERHGADDARIGFFGATPVNTQLITGANDSALLNSVVAALVAYGLFVDDR